MVSEKDGSGEDVHALGYECRVSCKVDVQGQSRIARVLIACKTVC